MVGVVGGGGGVGSGGSGGVGARCAVGWVGTGLWLAIGRGRLVGWGWWVLVEEVEVSASEAFAGGWGVGVRPDAGLLGGAVEVVLAGFVVVAGGGGDGLSGGVEGVAPLVGEHDAG